MPRTRQGEIFKSPPQGEQEVPKEVNWDCWLAQVRWREYHAEWINLITCRDTSIGELGNFGPHTANMAFMALNVKDLWIDACRNGQAPLANFEHAAPFAEFLAVGSLATRFPGEPIKFEPGTGQITNHPRAAGHLRYEYRKGYII